MLKTAVYVGDDKYSIFYTVALGYLVLEGLKYKKRTPLCTLIMLNIASPWQTSHVYLWLLSYDGKIVMTEQVKTPLPCFYSYPTGWLLFNPLPSYGHSPVNYIQIWAVDSESDYFFNVILILICPNTFGTHRLGEPALREGFSTLSVHLVVMKIPRNQSWQTVL